MDFEALDLNQNLHIIYNYLCGSNPEQVYVDIKGVLKFDSRHWLCRWFYPCGDYAREKVNSVVVQTLEKLVQALDKGKMSMTNLVWKENLSEHPSEVCVSNSNRWGDAKKFASDVQKLWGFPKCAYKKLGLEMTEEEKITLQVYRLTETILNKIHSVKKNQ